MTGDLRIISNNVLRKLFIKGPKYREVRPINLEKAKRCILECLDKCISSWFYKNGVDKPFFLEWTNNVKIKIDERRVIWQVNYIQINIEIAYHLQM